MILKMGATLGRKTLLISVLQGHSSGLGFLLFEPEVWGIGCDCFASRLLFILSLGHMLQEHPAGCSKAFVLLTCSVCFSHSDHH